MIYNPYLPSPVFIAQRLVGCSKQLKQIIQTQHDTFKIPEGPSHDLVIWYKITYTGEQVAQWDFQNKGRCIVLEVPLCNLLTSICSFVPCLVVFEAYEKARREIGGTEVHRSIPCHGDPARRSHVEQPIVLVKTDDMFVPIVEAGVMDAGILV